MRAFWLLMLLALDERTAGLVEQIAASGQVAEIATPSAERLSAPGRIAPGAPPAFGKMGHRFGDLDLVLDNAGH